MFDFSTIDEVRLAKGAHKSPSEGLCFMEMVAWFAGEKHSDRPDCACPVLGRYGIILNDQMPADVRDPLLKPLVPLIAGTRDEASERKRAEFLALWAVNKVLPPALLRAGLEDHAARCAAATNLAAARGAWTSRLVARAATRGAWVARAADVAWAAAWSARHARAADAAAWAAARSAAEAGEWELGVEGLRQAILIGRHDGFQIAEPLLLERRAKLKEIA